MTTATVVASLDEAIEVVAWDGAGHRWLAGDAAGAVVASAGPAPADGTGAVTAVHGPTGRFAVGRADGSVDIETGPAAGWTRHHLPSAVQDLRWSPDHRLAVGAGSWLHCFDRTLAPTPPVGPLSGQCRRIRWADGPAPLVVAGLGGLHWVDPDGVAPNQTWEAVGAARCVEVSGASGLVASGDLVGTLRLTDPRSLQEVAIRGWSGRIERLAWDGPGRGLAVAGADEVTLWHLPDLTGADHDPMLLHGHDADVTAVAFGGPDGTVPLSGDDDGVVLVWDSVAGHPWSRHRLPAAVRALAPRPGTDELLAGLADGTLHRIHAPRRE